MTARGPLGVFDSGVGGLTVLRALREAMPAEHFIYLGDTARLPYGTKSAASALIARRIRCLVVACNTASASALEALRGQHPTLPVHRRHRAGRGGGGRGIQVAAHRRHRD